MGIYCGFWCCFMNFFRNLGSFFLKKLKKNLKKEQKNFTALDAHSNNNHRPSCLHIRYLEDNLCG